MLRVKFNGYHLIFNVAIPLKSNHGISLQQKITIFFQNPFN